MSSPEKQTPEDRNSSAPQTTSSTQESATQTTPTKQRNNLVLYLLLAATFVVFLNETIMGVALNRLSQDLGVIPNVVQWLTTAFMLTMAVVIPMTGSILQRTTTRQAFTLAMGLFTVGTFVALIAPGFEVLLIARIIQASGTAIMLPLLMTSVMQLVPPESRGKTMGNISIVISVAPALGPAAAGALLTLGSWRWIFAVMLPLAIIMLVVGSRLITNINEPRKSPVDIPSVILSALGFSGVVLGLNLLGDKEIPRIYLITTLVVGSVCLLTFILRQLKLQKKDRALLDLRTFQNPNFTVAIIHMAIGMMALFGTIVVLPLFMLNALGVSQLNVGLLLVPGGLLMGLSAPLVGRLYDRVGPRPLVVPGTILGGMAMWAFTTVNSDTSPYLVMAMHILLSLGLGMVFTPLFTAGMASVKPTLYSHGSAMIGTVQQVAGAAGTALFVAVLSTRLEQDLGQGVAAPEAYSNGVHLAFLIGAGIFSLTLITAFLIKKPADPPAESSTDIESSSSDAPADAESVTADAGDPEATPEPA